MLDPMVEKYSFIALAMSDEFSITLSPTLILVIIPLLLRELGRMIPFIRDQVGTSNVTSHGIKLSHIVVSTFITYQTSYVIPKPNKDIPVITPARYNFK